MECAMVDISHDHGEAVVIVDDDPAVRSFLKCSLEVDGYRVVPYASGRELLNEDVLPACACYVIDYNMPGISGLDLVGRLRDENVRTPIILISSAPRRTLVNRAVMLGVRLIEKPIIDQELLDHMHRVVGRHH
jgi:two-component system response regulator FixJ